MEYSVTSLAKMVGVSVRTLHYYDEIQLLSPKRTSKNAYRVYGRKEVDLLQQILFYRELEIPLDEIKKIISSKDYDSVAALQGHLLALKAKKQKIESLITNVEKTIMAAKGEITMSDSEKFECFKKDLIDENEKKYGDEIRKKYGDDTINESNAKMMGLTSEQYEKSQELERQIRDLLKADKNPSSQSAQELCKLHKEWLMYFWTHYSKEAHLGLIQTYIHDSRFRNYISKEEAEFLFQAMQNFTDV